MDGSQTPLQEWFASLSPAQQRGIFWGSLLGVSAVLIALFTRTRNSQSESRFQVREHERDPVRRPKGPSSQHARPLLLPGARLDAPPHELLGISSNATPSEIQKAYRAQMLRYHPDRVGQSGGVSQETQQAAAQISQALTQARDALLARAERRGRRS